MSVSIFETEMTETERRVRELNQELESETKGKGGFLDRVKLARQKMENIKLICQQKVLGNPLEAVEVVCVVPEFDELKKGIKGRILKNVLVEKAPKEDRSSSPSSRPGKSRQSTVKDLGIASPLRKKNRKTKEGRQKMSVFIRKVGAEKDDEKKRNSAIIQGFGERIFGETQQKKSKFAGGANFTGGEGAPLAQRDSIDLVGEHEGIHRPSTLLQMRNSLFKFDTSVMVNNVIAEEDLNIDEVLSDLSDGEPEIDMLDEDDEDLRPMKDRILKIQVLQEDNHFLTTTASYAFNATSVFDDEQLSSDKFAQRVKLLESHHNDSSACLFVHNDKLMQERPAYIDDLSCEPYLKLDGKAKAPANTLLVERLVEKNGRLADVAHTHEARQISKCALSVVYSNNQCPGTKISLAANGHTVQAFKLYPKFSELHFTSEKIFQLETRGDSEVTVTTGTLPVLINFELTKDRTPILLKTGDEFFFNQVDGLRVEGILPAGFDEEAFEAFKPTHRQWDIECLNRHIHDPSVFKYFLLADKKFNKTDPDFFEKTMKECFTSHKNLSRILKFKKEYLIRMCKKSKNSILKLSLIRKYDTLGLSKKVSEILIFLSDPYDYEENPDPAFLSSIKERLKQQFLTKKNQIQVGKSLQSRLPKIRNDFEKSNLLYAIDTDYDLEFGYSKESKQFFLKAGDATEEPLEIYKEPTETPQSINCNNLTSLFKGLHVGYNLNEPREAFWIPLKNNTTVRIPNNSLLSYGTTVARVSNSPINII